MSTTLTVTYKTMTGKVKANCDRLVGRYKTVIDKRIRQMMTSDRQKDQPAIDKTNDN